MKQYFLLLVFGFLLAVGCRQPESQLTKSEKRSGDREKENSTESGIPDLSDSESIANQVKEFLDNFEIAQREFGKRVQKEVQAGRITSNEGILKFTEEHGPEAKAREDAMRITVANSGVEEVFPLIEWLISNTDGDQQAKVWEEVMRNHIGNQAVGELILSNVSITPSQEAEFRFKKIIEESPHARVRALATSALANHMMSIQRIQGIWDQVNWKETSETQLAYLKNYQVGNQSIERLYKKVLDEYSDAFGDDANDVAFIEKVEATLNEVKNFSVGKTAPEIEGRDFNGDPIKLSDYRGKVVLLVFWHHF